MNRFAFLAAAMVAAVSLPVAAQATDRPMGAGHYEWQTAAQTNPRAPLAPPRRLWVADHQASAGRHCMTMRSRAADCMATMPGSAPARRHAG